MIKISTKIGLFFLALFLMAPAFAQDNRRLETKVADVLAQFPAQSVEHTAKLMAEILETGAPGIAQFCDRVVAPGTGNDSQARMALESLAQYAGAPNRESNRKVVESALLAAIEKATDKEVKAFFIRRLQYCGGTESVTKLEKYLNSSELYGPALAALTSIGKTESGAVVLKNLQGKSGLQQVAMVKTLGQLKYQPAENSLIELAQTAKGELLQHTYAALAAIGGKASVATFETAAKAVGFQPNPTSVMDSYMQLAKRLAAKGSKGTDSCDLGGSEAGATGDSGAAGVDCSEVVSAAEA